MLRRPPSSTRTALLFPYSTLCRARKVSATNAFGIALADDTIYAATTDGTGRECVVFAGERGALDGTGRELRWRRLYSVAIKDPGERVHQISVLEDALDRQSTRLNSSH